MNIKVFRVLVKVLKIGASYAYPSCSICHKKVRKVNDQKERLWCSFCLKFYSQKTVQYRYHVNLTVSDGSGITRVTVFGKSLEAFFGLPATEFCRYLANCGEKNFLQGLSLDRMVHFAMERCFVGENVHLAFHLTGNKNSAHNLQTNVLPAMKASNLSTYSKIPELLANGICRIQNEIMHKSVAGVFKEYVAHFEENVEADSFKITNNNTTENCVNSIASRENINSFNEKDCDIDDVVSPRRLLVANSNVNKFMLSMMSSGNDSNIKTEDSFVPKFKSLQRSTCCEHNQVSDVESNTCKIVKSVSRIQRGHENVSITDLQQSLCYDSSNEDDPYVLTIIKEDKPNSDFLTTEDAKLSKSLSEENLNPVHGSTNTGEHCTMSGIQSGVLIADDIPLDGISSEKNCAVTCHLPQDQCVDGNNNSANNEFDMMFDSLTSEDLDIFLTQVNPTLQSEKSDHDEKKHCLGDAVESNSSSSSDAVHLDHDRRTCFTSTPSLDIYHETSHLESVINCGYSPIDSHSITTPLERTFCDNKNDKFPGDGEIERDMFTPPGRPQPGTSECVSNCLCLRTKCKKSSCKKPFKGKLKNRNLSRGVTSSKKSTWCSEHTRMRISMSVSSKRDQVVLKPVNVSSEVSSPYVPPTRRRTFLEKSSERSLLLFEDERNVDESENDAPVTPECSESQVRAKDPNSCLINRDRDRSEDNMIDEYHSFVTSPLLFSP
ncbi:DNA damage-induced apoptosis suppressor protein-like [Dendronephthya gigantea]|uniref:DNA damage-induced apoptosis suppressor protein-like n=1 Tax=Dendronephthya gigantea TaxID=151771 RepID=UPI0010697B78|nr:DNA damage-induced apoptosis suppressor protein-like [Dendronephthya gigantea]